MTHDPESLPREAADRFTKPFARFLKIEAASGGLLLLAVLVAMALANSRWGGAYLAPFFVLSRGSSRHASSHLARRRWTMA